MRPPCSRGRPALRRTSSRPFLVLGIRPERMELGAPVTLQVTPPLTAMAPPGVDAPAVGDGPSSRGGRRWKASSAASASRDRGARCREARRSMVVAFPAAADLLDNLPDLLLPERRRPLRSCCCRPPPNLHLPEKMDNKLKRRYRR